MRTESEQLVAELFDEIAYWTVDVTRIAQPGRLARRALNEIFRLQELVDGMTADAHEAAEVATTGGGRQDSDEPTTPPVWNKTDVPQQTPQG